MNQYAIRIDDREGYKELLTTFFTEVDYKDVLIVSHSGRTGENIHYHICVSTTLKSQALRKRLKVVFTLGKGNGHMSLKDWDGNEKALSYMFHEDEATIIYNKTYSTDDISRFKEINATVQADIKNNSPNTIVSKVVTDLLENPKRYRDHKSIFFAISTIIYENGDFFPNKFQMDRWITKVQMLLCQDDEFSRRRFFEMKYNEMYDKY